MKTMHLHLVESSNATDARTMAIQTVFTQICGSDPDPLEVEHLNGLIALGVSAEGAKKEFTLRRLRRLREA